LAAFLEDKNMATYNLSSMIAQSGQNRIANNRAAMAQIGGAVEDIFAARKRKKFNDELTALLEKQGAPQTPPTDAPAAAPGTTPSASGDELAALKAREEELAREIALLGSGQGAFQSILDLPATPQTRISDIEAL
jgi:hypothetical protein